MVLWRQCEERDGTREKHDPLGTKGQSGGGITSFQLRFLFPEGASLIQCGKKLTVRCFKHLSGYSSKASTEERIVSSEVRMFPGQKECVWQVSFRDSRTENHRDTSGRPAHWCQVGLRTTGTRIGELSAGCLIVTSR